MSRFGTLLAAALAALAIASACRESSPSSECLRSPVQLERLDRAMTSCAVDDDCPCGSACALGVCSYDCATDAECGGAALRCDERGRCVP
jgi:hypothetical protein